MKKRITIITCLFLSIGLFAQVDSSSADATSDELITDRPDATESPNTVPLKKIQIETGGLFVSNNEEGIKTELWNYNNTLIRYGVLKNFELRLAFAISETREGLNNEDLKVIASSFSGNQDLLLGAGMSYRFPN